MTLRTTRWTNNLRSSRN